jgi:ubiquinone/menaquinone biosynthesis C-methylase UbiE
MNSNFLHIKEKIMSIQPNKYWGDDFDVRYYAISRLIETKNHRILDAGGGIGIISSELEKNNECINLDLNFSELLICKSKISKTIQNINGVMNFMPFRDNTFDQIVCCHVLDAGKYLDIKNNNVNLQDKVKEYPTVQKFLKEFNRILKKEGKITLTVPNNAAYKGESLEYEELKKALLSTFPKHSIYFFNTFPKFGKNRKLNLGNIIPKLVSLIIGQKSMLDRLAKKEDRHSRYSISFYVEARKD